MGLLEEVKSEKRITYLKALAEKVNKEYGAYVSYGKYKLADTETLRKEILKVLRKAPKKVASPRKASRRVTSPSKRLSKRIADKDVAFYKSVLEIRPPRIMSREETIEMIDFSGREYLADNIGDYFMEVSGGDVEIYDLNVPSERANYIWTSYTVRLARARNFGPRDIVESIVEGPEDAKFYVLTSDAAPEIVTLRDIPNVVRTINRMHKSGVVNGLLSTSGAFYQERKDWRILYFTNSIVYSGEVPQHMKICDYALLIASTRDTDFISALKAYLSEHVFTSEEMEVLSSLKTCDTTRVMEEHAKLPLDEQHPGRYRRFDRSTLPIVLSMLDWYPLEMLKHLKPAGAADRFRTTRFGDFETDIIRHHLEKIYRKAT